MKQKFVWMAALAVTVIGLDLSVATDADAQIMRRLMGRNNNCCSDSCDTGCDTGCCDSGCGQVAVAQVSYAAPIQSDCGCQENCGCQSNCCRQGIFGRRNNCCCESGCDSGCQSGCAQAISYAAPETYAAAPVSYEAAPSYETVAPAYSEPAYSAPVEAASDCGCASAAPVSYEQSPIVSTGCSSCGETAAPVTFASSDCGCGAEVAPVSYTTSSDCGCPSGDCSGEVAASYDTGCQGCEGSTIVEGSVEGSGCPSGDCGGGEVVYEAASSEMTTETPQEYMSDDIQESSTTVDAPVDSSEAPAAPAEDESDLDEDREA